jgi:hypothetical protein
VHWAHRRHRRRHRRASWSASRTTWTRSLRIDKATCDRRCRRRRRSEAAKAATTGGRARAATAMTSPKERPQVPVTAATTESSTRRARRLAALVALAASLRVSPEGDKCENEKCFFFFFVQFFSFFFYFFFFFFFFFPFFYSQIISQSARWHRWRADVCVSNATRKRSRLASLWTRAKSLIALQTVHGSTARPSPPPPPNLPLCQASLIDLIRNLFFFKLFNLFAMSKFVFHVAFDSSLSACSRRSVCCRVAMRRSNSSKSRSNAIWLKNARSLMVMRVEQLQAVNRFVHDFFFFFFFAESFFGFGALCRNSSLDHSKQISHFINSSILYFQL